MTSSNSTEAASSVEVETRRHAQDAPWTYEALNQRQREIAERIRQGGPGALLLSEVAPVITVGRRAGPSEILLPRERLASAGVSLAPTDRGGLATYHGPGQWVLFAVDQLERLTGDSRGVRKAVEGLLEIALEVGRLYDARAEIRAGAQTGVWTSRGKFAAVGVHIERGILLHGLSVNGFRTSTSFLGLRPCGLDLPVDFLLENRELDEASREAAFLELHSRLVSRALQRFWPRRG